MIDVDIDVRDFQEVLKQWQRATNTALPSIIKKAAYEFTRSAVAATPKSKNRRKYKKIHSKKIQKKTGMKGYIKFYKNNKPVWRLAKDGNDPRRKIKRQGLAKFAWWKALQEATGRTKKDKPGLGIVKRYTKGINGLKTIKPFVELQNNLNYVGIIAPNAARRAIKKATSSMAGQLADKAKDLSK